MPSSQHVEQLMTRLLADLLKSVDVDLDVDTNTWQAENAVGDLDDVLERHRDQIPAPVWTELDKALDRLSDAVRYIEADVDLPRTPARVGHHVRWLLDRLDEAGHAVTPKVGA